MSCENRAFLWRGGNDSGVTDSKLSVNSKFEKAVSFPRARREPTTVLLNNNDQLALGK